MTQYKKYSFILAVALIGIGCTTPGSTGQLTQSCSDACVSPYNNPEAICWQYCNNSNGIVSDAFTESDCSRACTDLTQTVQCKQKEGDSGLSPLCANYHNACYQGCITWIATLYT